jgi:hypothetical protein
VPCRVGPCPGVTSRPAAKPAPTRGSSSREIGPIPSGDDPTVPGPQSGLRAGWLRSWLRRDWLSPPGRRLPQQPSRRSWALTQSETTAPLSVRCVTERPFGRVTSTAPQVHVPQSAPAVHGVSFSPCGTATLGLRGRLVHPMTSRTARSNRGLATDQQGALPAGTTATRFQRLATLEGARPVADNSPSARTVGTRIPSGIAIMMDPYPRVSRIGTSGMGGTVRRPERYGRMICPVPPPRTPLRAAVPS